MAKLISVGSGKGGVGKSFVTANLATLLAKSGKSVTLVDLDTGGANANIMFGLMKTPHTLTDFLNGNIKSLQNIAHPIDGFYGLEIISGTGETLQSANMPWATKQKLLSHLHKLDSDYVIIDVGAGTSLNVLDFFNAADIHLCIATNEPTAVLDLYRFIKLAGLRRALSAFLAHDQVTQILAKQDFKSINEIFNYAGSIKEGAREKAEIAISGFNPRLVINMAQKDRASNLRRLQNLLYEYLGVKIPVIGSIPIDEEVRNSIRRYQPIVSMSPNHQVSLALRAISEGILGHKPVTQVSKEPIIKVRIAV